MKNSMAVEGLTASVSMLAGLSAAAAAAAGSAVPTSATAESVSSFVERYTARSIAHAKDVTLYPTADRDVVFVSFRIAGKEHIALAETHAGRVTRFTDFAGARPRNVPIIAAQVGDAQDQAQSILSTASSHVAVIATPAAQDERWTDVQARAADVLQFALVSVAVRNRTGIAERNLPRALADGQQEAAAVLTASGGE